MALSLSAGLNALNAFQALEKPRKQAFFDDAKQGLRLLEKNNIEGYLDLASKRLQAVESLGGDPSDVRESVNDVISGNIPKAINDLSIVMQHGIDTGFLKDPEIENEKIKGSRTATQKDFATFQELTNKAIESGDPKDKKKADRFGRAARFIRETEQEKADIKVTQKEREAVTKANVKRKQGFIDSGIEAANGAANIRRGLKSTRWSRDGRI